MAIYKERGWFTRVFPFSRKYWKELLLFTLTLHTHAEKKRVRVRQMRARAGGRAQAGTG
jgi:hypothetical protein